MRYYGKKSLSQVLSIMLNLILIVGVIMTALVYYKTFFVNIEALVDANKLVMGTLLTIGIVCIFLIVIELKKMIATLINENPFVWENVKSLKKISIECFIVGGCYLANFIVNLGKDTYKFIYLDSKGIHTDIEPIIFVLAGIFILILSNIFRKAVEYKEENDFTI